MAHIPIVGAVEPVLQEMLAQLKQLNVSKPNPEAIAAWWSQINEWRKVHGLKYENPSDGTMKPQQVVETLYKVTNGDAIITSDVGQHQMFAHFIISTNVLANGSTQVVLAPWVLVYLMQWLRSLLSQTNKLFVLR